MCDWIRMRLALLGSWLIDRFGRWEEDDGVSFEELIKVTLAASADRFADHLTKDNALFRSLMWKFEAEADDQDIDMLRIVYYESSDNEHYFGWTETGYEFVSDVLPFKKRYDRVDD